jgi:hypothetical protein
MSFVRMMTFNAQLLPVIPVLHPSPGDEAVVRAAAIGTAIAALPPHELPHIIAFNEVFNEDGRVELLQHLSPLYPHIIDTLDDCFLGQDSGLMLVSQFPFLALPAHLNPLHQGRVLFFSYPNLREFFPDLDVNSLSSWEANLDILACKGVGVVQIECPLGIVTLAFTHAQAFYKHEDQYRDMRRTQMADIGTTLARVLGNPPSPNWGRVVVLGDFNIRGDLGATKGEWNDIFATSPSIFTDHLCDGWRTYMKPPPRPHEVDPGFTVNNLEAGENGELPAGLLLRLDYACFSTQPGDEVLVPQHMWTRFRTLSDHWSLEADVHLRTPQCTPSDALLWADIPPLSSEMRVAHLMIEEAGSYQWVYVDTPGTYTVFPPLNMEVALFLEDDLSTPWNPYDQVHVAGIGIPQLDIDVHEHGERLDPRGGQYDLPKPFFIRLRGGVDNPHVTGPCLTGIYRHTGETRETSILLRPWEAPKDPMLPQGQPNGQADDCWFRAHLGRALSGQAHTSTFFVQNSTGHVAGITLFDQNGQQLHHVAGNQPEIIVQHTASGPETVYLLLKRSALTDTGFRAGWRSGLTYLRSVPNVRPMGLRCEDETGPDWAGADEITLRLFADDLHPHFFETFWNDADATELLKLEGHVPGIAFVDRIEVWAKEADFIQGAAATTHVPALTDLDPPVKAIEQRFNVEFGTYRFECTLARSPQ